MAWVYIKSQSDLWTTGFYHPGGEWEAESDHSTAESAAKRVHYLNGGTDEILLGACRQTIALFSNPSPTADPCVVFQRVQAAVQAAEAAK